MSCMYYDLDAILAEEEARTLTTFPKVSPSHASSDSACP